MPSRRKLLKMISVAPIAAQFLGLKSIAQNPAAQNAPAPDQHAPNPGADINQHFPPQLAGSPVGEPLPGQKWLVHDRARPQARKVTPGLPIPQVQPSSDAIVLFDGKDLSQWGTIGRDGKITDPTWKVENGYVEMVPRTGSLITETGVRRLPVHLEWMTPTGADASHVGQMRGNSGVILMKQYEIQVLSSFDNPTYADGAAGALYGLYPPLVNPCRPEGEWNS